MQQRHILCVQPPRMVDFPLQAMTLVKLAFDEDLLNPKSTGLLIDVYGDLAGILHMSVNRKEKSRNKSGFTTESYGGWA